MNVVELWSCPVCDNSRFERVDTPRTWLGKPLFDSVSKDIALQRCTACGFVFVNPRPAEALVQSFYRAGKDYDCHDLGKYRDPALRNDYVLSLVERHRPGDSGGRLLDFGCGTGSFVEGARKRGWDAIGFDIGERARRACAERGVPFCESLESLLSERFDVITMNHVFEHVYDYPTFFRVFDQLVKDESVVYVEVPNARSLRARLSLPALTRLFSVDERYRAFPLHLSYFGPRTLPALFERFGYELVDQHNFGVGIDEYFANGAGSRAAFLPPPAESAVAPTGRSATVASLAKSAIKRSLFAMNLGENIAVVVRKAGPVTWTELENGCVLASCGD